MQFDASARECIQQAIRIANDYGHESACLSHMLYSMIEYSETIRVAVNNRIYFDNFTSSVRATITKMPRNNNERRSKKSDKFLKMESLADEECQRRDGKAVSVTDILYGIIRSEDEKITHLFLAYSRDNSVDAYALRKAFIRAEGREDKNIVTIEEEGVPSKKYSQCEYCNARVDEGVRFCCRTCELKKNLKKRIDTRIYNYDDPPMYYQNDYDPGLW